VEAFLQRLDPGKLSFADPHGSTACLASLASGEAAARCALNIALMDGASRRAHQPLCDYAGLGFTEGQHVTSFTIGIDDPERIRKKVLEAADWPVLKMKLGVPEDEANLRALREAAPGKTIRVDANEGWTTPEQALKMIEWLASNGPVQFVEQPMPASASAQDWKWLKERSPLPIFADESYHTAADLNRVADCFHGVNVKLVKSGGFSGGLEALAKARQAGLKTMLGCMIETSVLISAGAHLAELCDYLDLDGNVLITNDPFLGARASNGLLSFLESPEIAGLRVCPQKPVF
jgi:L-alanine-DL-glutamate epimerase-like enolase superfamily enzyme